MLQIQLTDYSNSVKIEINAQLIRNAAVNKRFAQRFYSLQ